MDNHNHQLCNSGEDDRLSSLPDSLLISILSLMPISSAVATSVLSHRWRHLWTFLTHISFHYHFDFHSSFEDSFLNCISTVNHIISKLASPKIHTFHLILPPLDISGQICYSLLVPTIHQICLRNPEVINIDSNNCGFESRNLTSSLFNTQSLVELKFDSTFEFDFVADAPFVINLPNLKILDIFLYDSHLRLMHTLFESCPLLERLCLHLMLEEVDHHVDIIAPNLKFLTIDCHVHYFLLIDAPMLVNLETFGRFAHSSVSYHFVTNLRCLQEAEISIPKYHVGDVNSYLSRIVALFQGICCARSLTFNGCFHNPLMEVALPGFPNLVDLKLEGFELGSSSWMPGCLLKNVKSLKIFSMKPNGYGIRLLQDILTNATVLEKLQVSHYRYDDMHGPLKTRVWDEYEFAMKLFNLQKNSSSCQIELDGGIITASCEDFRYGQLTCKLQDLILYA